MKVATVAVAYNEERFIGPHLAHIPNWVDENLVLVSTVPWQGEADIPDNTDIIAREHGATVICHDWRSEHEQRNAGQEYLSDYDWIIVLDPDEFLDDAAWAKLHDLIYEELPAEAFTPQVQNTYWKDRYVIDPPEEYKQVILVKPSVRFFDKRCVDCPYAELPIDLHHMSWARTDAECLSKISHYAHAHELNKTWYKDVWLADKMENVHPMTPEALKRVVPAILPKELEDLHIWPTMEPR